MNEENTARASLVRPGAGERLTFDWGEITWIASGAVGNARQMTFGRVVIKAGRQNAGHRHPDSEEILHLLSGRLAHAVDDEVFAMAAGDSIIIPAGARHHAAAVGDEDAVMLVFYPTAERRIETG